MRVTIQRQDGFVSVDGEGFLGLDLTFIDPDIRALQWYDDKGELEWSVDGRSFNTDVVSLVDFQPALDAWQVAKIAYEASLIPDPNAVPEKVTPYQARIALLQAGYLASVEAMMADPNTPTAAKIAWEYATIWERQSAFIATLGPALGLTEGQIDDLFRAASLVV